MYVCARTGYGFVDFDSPAAAQKAVASLKASGVQAQMAKVSFTPACHSLVCFSCHQGVFLWFVLLVDSITVFKPRRTQKGSVVMIKTEVLVDAVSGHKNNGDNSSAMLIIMITITAFSL